MSQIKCVIKEGFPPFVELTPLHTGYEEDGGSWEGFVRVNEEIGKEIDPETERPYGGLSRDELEALADFVLTECPNWGKKELVDNYWLIGDKKIDVGRLDYLYLLERIYERGSEPVVGVLKVVKATIDALNTPEPE